MSLQKEQNKAEYWQRKKKMGGVAKRVEKEQEEEEEFRNRERRTDIDMTRDACLDLHLEHSSNSNLSFFSPILDYACLRAREKFPRSSFSLD
jgi:hypothetical protein